MAPYLGLKGRKLALVRVAMIVVPAFLLFGYNQSQTGGIINYSSFIETFPQTNTKTTKGAVKSHNANVQGTAVAIYTIGCMFGALSCPFTGNRIGRRKTLLLYAIIATLGHILQSSSYSLPQLIVGRVVSGLGVGGINAIVPCWQSECTKPKSRGKNVVVLGVFLAAGQALAAWVNYGLGVIPNDPVAWRLPLAMPIIFTLWIMASIYMFPESPRWLVLVNRIEEATRVKTILDDLPEDSEIVRAEIMAIQASIELEGGSRSWKDILFSGRQRLFYRACLGFAVNFSAQMTGANAISFYATVIFENSLLFRPRLAALLAAVLLSWKIFTSSLSLLIVDRFGRKPLFMLAGFGTSSAMTFLAITVSMISKPAAGRAATFFFFYYFTFFTLGFLGANFLYATEVAPQDLRVHFAAIGAATHWLFNFLIVEVTPISFTNIGYRTYIIYAVISAFIVPLVYFVFPETKGRSLEEVDNIFSLPEHWWQVTKVARELPMSVLTRMENEDDEELAHKEFVAKQHAITEDQVN